MQFTGTQLVTKRNIYTQNLNFGFALDCYVDNTTGRYEFGVSGDNGAFAFTLQSGRISVGTTFLHSYAPFERFTIECQITPNLYNVLKQDVPLVYGLAKPSGNYDYVYFARENATLFADFGFQVSGQNLPIATIQDRGYLLTTGQNAVTGLFLNQGSYPMRVFGSAATVTQGLDFGELVGTVPPGGSGAFAFTGDFTSFEFANPIPVDFQTSFNNASISFTIIDARSFNRFVLLQDISNFSFSTDGVMNRTLAYSNYSGGFTSDSFNANLSFSLQYLSGAGTFSTPDFIDGLIYSTTCFGSFQQSGTLTGKVAFATGDAGQSGSFIIDVTRFGWATGLATGYFVGVGTGLGSGLGYTGAAYGDVTGKITAFIRDGSGTFLFNSNAAGSGFNAVSVNYPSYVNATGYLTVSGLRTDDFFHIGIMSTPLIKGVQFTNETGLVHFLSGAPQFKVRSYTTSGIVYLESLLSGSVGNDIFVTPDSCNVGTMAYTPFLLNGQDIGATGQPVFAVSPFIAQVSQTLTGTGFYAVHATGFGDGVFFYTKTFTGSWDLLTGIDQNNLVSVKRAGNFNSGAMSGIGAFPPNSVVNFQVVHTPDAFGADAATLIISGAEVLNPIFQSFSV